VMRDTATKLGRRLGRRGVEPTVDLHGVAADDLAVDPQGELEGQLGLAGAGGAEDGDQGCVRRSDSTRRVSSCASRTVACRWSRQ
jgi:hypothetical protein